MCKTYVCISVKLPFILNYLSLPWHHSFKCFKRSGWSQSHNLPDHTEGKSLSTSVMELICNQGAFWLCLTKKSIWFEWVLARTLTAAKFHVIIKNTLLANNQSLLSLQAYCLKRLLIRTSRRHTCFAVQPVCCPFLYSLDVTLPVSTD